MNPERKSIHNYKFVEPPLAVLRGLGACLDLTHKDAFKGTYGNLLGILNTEVTAVHTLVQFYDPPFRCFTFQDYQLAPTLEEYSHIFGIRIKNQVPYIRTKELPEYRELAEALHMGNKEIELNLKPKGGIHGFTSKFLVDKAITFAEAGRWMAFNAHLALLIYGIILFSNMEEFVDLAAIHIFLTPNPIPTLLADTYYSIHVRTQKKKGTIVCCTPLLYRWYILHLPSEGPFVENKYNLKWSQRIMSLKAEDIPWYSRVYDGVKLILNCGDFPNVHLLGTKGGINYNPRLALRQHGYAMVDKPDLESVEGFVLYKGVKEPELIKKIVKAWGSICPQGRAEMGKKNCIAKEAYTSWVKSRVSEVLLSFPPEPSMNLQSFEIENHPNSEMDELKKVIKTLEKENADLKSKLAKISLEKETLKFNLNQKRDRVRQAEDEVQTEFFKRLKVGDTLRGTYASFTIKKKQLAEAQYRAGKAELEHMEQMKKLQSLLEACKKELKDERSHNKQLEVTLRQNQYGLNQKLEEIQKLKEQSHGNPNDNNMQLNERPEDPSDRGKTIVNNPPVEESAMLGKWSACLSPKSQAYYEELLSNCF
ncbi:uncharacterized protein LOC127104147 [Lathyrus oleraceus]|uniref:uncharacterized protein LOC127104147 n=1 Tax=Pisum sativum TaxID=3888 RepID=UPI0021CF8C4D|nr:uncharacterized protein LOC127104147 [Pisum sativum]